MAAAEPLQPTIYPLLCEPGIKRDGTQTEGRAYIDGEWVRFQRGLPRKMGGCRQITDAVNGPVRGCYVHPHDNGYARVYSGYNAGFEYVDIDMNGASGGVVSRTPVSFPQSDDYLWQIAALYNQDPSNPNMAILAHPGENLADIGSEVETPVYYGDIDTAAALAELGQSVSGGVCSVQPYIFIYGTDGLLTWCAPNEPINFSTTDGGGGPAATSGSRIAASKIVRGFQTRAGPANSPSALFWSLDALTQASWVGGDSIFRFTAIAGASSVLSSQGIIENDGLFYWPGIDRFLMYNGVVRETMNDKNINWFYDNLNFAYRQKVWAYKVPRFGEIWYFFPFGSATECNAAVILNAREGTTAAGLWYDTGFSPLAKRSAGYYSQVFRYPIQFGHEETDDGTYRLFQHEFGVDQTIDGREDAVLSKYTTADFSYAGTGPAGEWTGVDANIRQDRIEPDFVQTGDMTVTISGRAHPKQDNIDIVTKTFAPTTLVIDYGTQARFMNFTFESNVAGGDFQCGQPMIRFDVGEQDPGPSSG